MVEIEESLPDLIEAKQQGDKNGKAWFKKLLPFFDFKFGDNWKEKAGILAGFR